MPDDGWQEFHPVERDPDDNDQWGVIDDPTAAQAKEEEQDAWEDDEPVASFDPRWRDQFEGLTYIGHLEGDVEVPYHTFRVKTLTTGEKIKIVALVRDHEESIGYPRAYRAAVVAAGLLLVDGKPLLVGQKNVDVISQRYRYITDHWYDYIVDLLYDKINELEGTVLEVLKELGIYQTRREVVQVSEAEVAGQTEAS